MYKTIVIIIIIIVVRRPIIIGLSNCPSISPQCRTSHTRKWGLRPKYTSAVHVHIHTLSLLRNFLHQEGSRTVAHPVRVQAIFWDRASQVGGSAHVLSSSVRTLLLSILWMLRGRGCARDGTERGKWRSL